MLRSAKYELLFRKPAVTSRDILYSKPSWILILTDENKPERIFHGECSVIPGLSIDDLKIMDAKIAEICNKVNQLQSINFEFDLSDFPAVEFGYEMLIRDYQSDQEKILFQSGFSAGHTGIKINGLVWMGNKKTMFEQIRNKIETGWRCIKLKIGGLEFEEELELLKYIRSQFQKSELELRLDANGAFTAGEAFEKLKVLSEFDIHSIEQPIRQGQMAEMAQLCLESPIPVALDEELIGIKTFEEKRHLLETINPHYIILKPGLIGGIKKSEEWIDIAIRKGIGYWITSALESNIGLNAIAQWTAIAGENITHGLGTGMLYSNNFDSPLTIEGSELIYRTGKKWIVDL